MHVIRFLLIAFFALSFSGLTLAAELGYNHDGKRGAVILHPNETVEGLCAKLAETHGSEFRDPAKCFYRNEVITNLPYLTLAQLFKKRPDGVGHESLTLPKVGPVASVALRADARVAQLEQALKEMTTDRDVYRNGWNQKIDELSKLNQKLKSPEGLKEYSDLHRNALADIERLKGELNTARDKLRNCERGCTMLSIEWLQGLSWDKPPLAWVMAGIVFLLICCGAVLFLIMGRNRRSVASTATVVASPPDEPPVARESTVVRSERVRGDSDEITRLQGVETSLTTQLATVTADLEKKSQRVTALEAEVGQEQAKVNRLTQEKNDEKNRADTAETNRLSAMGQYDELRAEYLKQRDEIVPALKAEIASLEQQLAETRAEIKHMSKYVLGWIERCVLPANLFTDEEKGPSTIELWRTDGRLQKAPRPAETAEGEVVSPEMDPDMWCYYRLSGKFPNGVDNTVQGNLDGSLDLRLVIEAARTTPGFRREVEEYTNRTFKPAPAV